MPYLRDVYYALFCFWFRADLFTVSRDIRFFKAVSAVSVIQSWALFACYIWAETLLGIPRISKAQFAVVFILLWGANYGVLRIGKWEEHEKRLREYPAAKRRMQMGLSLVANLVVFLFLLLSLSVYRSAR